MLDINQIKEILPQRYPFLLLDRVTELEEGKRAVGIKNVSANEAFFVGHFPGNPIMPGNLISEAAAQLAIIFFHRTKKISFKKKLIYYLGSVKMKHLAPVMPGDQLKIEVTPVKVLANAGIVKAVATVDEKVVARGELGFSASEEGT